MTEVKDVTIHIEPSKEVTDIKAALVKLYVGGATAREFSTVLHTAMEVAEKFTKLDGPQKKAAVLDAVKAYFAGIAVPDETRAIIDFLLNTVAPNLIDEAVYRAKHLPAYALKVSKWCC